MFFDYTFDLFLKLTSGFAKKAFTQNLLQRFEGVWVAIERVFSMLLDYIFDANLGRPLNLRKKFFIVENFCTKPMLH